jgi:catechol 2,3-dioxygenase-like lactoylglutathione lyase family enzyme
MAVQLNHTIVQARDREASAQFYVDILGLQIAGRMGPFVVVAPTNDVTLDFVSVGNAPIHTQHYAFLVSDTEFDEIFGRVKERGLTYWADPFHRRPGEFNTDHGGRGVYFDDPDGHNLEIITHSYVLNS